LQMSQACLTEIEQMKNEGGEAAEAFTRYFAGLPIRSHREAERSTLPGNLKMILGLI